MRILARKTLTQFADRRKGADDHRALESALSAWFAEVSKASWSSSADVKAHYGTASIVGDRVVFNIKGNDYRLVVAIDYRRQAVFIRFLGTHSDYDKIDVRTVKYGD